MAEGRGVGLKASSKRNTLDLHAMGVCLLLIIIESNEQDKNPLGKLRRGSQTVMLLTNSYKGHC